MRHRRATGIALAALVALALSACSEDNPFRTITPIVTSGAGQVWELQLDGYPSGWDFATGDRFFVGTDARLSNPNYSATTGVWVLDERADGTLMFRPFSTIAPGITVFRVGIRDLGAATFASVEQAPDTGYSAVGDSTGVPVVEGHVYVFQISRLGSNIVPVNYAKLRVTGTGREDPADPASRYVRFEWAYQVQPLNRNVAVGL